MITEKLLLFEKRIFLLPSDNELVVLVFIFLFFLITSLKGLDISLVFRRRSGGCC